MHRVRLGIVPKFLQTTKIEDYFLEVSEEKKIELLCSKWIDIVRELSPSLPEDYILVALYEFEEIEK